MSLSADARARIAAQQAMLVAALVGDGTPPLDFDAVSLRTAAASLARKRARAAARALRQALAPKPSPEATRRLKQLLDKLGEEVQKEPPKRADTEAPQLRQLREQMGDPGEPNVPPPAWGVVRLQRAVEVLETIGTPEARETLVKLAKGQADDPLTREAKEALRRLSQTGVRP